MKKDVVILFYPNPWPGEDRGRIPYSLLYLERMIRSLGLQVILIDEQVQKNYIDLINKVKDRILLVGVSAMTGYQIQGGIDFSKKIKDISSALVLWGGWHVTILPEQSLEEDYVDLIIVGQGELPLQQLVSKLINGEDYTGVSGLGYKEGKIIIVNPPDKFVDIKTFPHVNFSLINLDNYVFKGAYSERCIGYFSSHGCPFDCAFCCVSKVYGRRWYSKEVSEIIKDLKYFKEVAQVDSITFDDDNFFVKKQFTLEFCKELIKEDLNLLWDTSAHAGLFLKLFSEEEVKLLYRAGCRQMYVGAESGDQDMLDLISKNTKVEDNYRFVQVLKKQNIVPMFSAMVCFPVNPEKDIDATLDMIRTAKLEDLSLRTRVFFYTPYPGTELYERALDKGFQPPMELSQWGSHTFRKFRAPWGKIEQVWKIEIFVNFYLPMTNPDYYKIAPKKLKLPLYIINKTFFPIAYLRFKLNFFKFPFEAILFLKILRVFNKVMKTQYSLGYESYLD